MRGIFQKPRGANKAAFIMTAPFYHADWIHTTNIYEVNLRQYTREGTFASFARDMPRLRVVRIEVLCCTPISPTTVEKRKGTLRPYHASSPHTSITPQS